MNDRNLILYYYYPKNKSVFPLACVDSSSCCSENESPSFSTTRSARCVLVSSVLQQTQIISSLEEVLGDGEGLSLDLAMSKYTIEEAVEDF